MFRQSAVTKWSKSRKRTRSITEPTVHIGGETTQVQNTEENKKNTAEIKQKYIIPRQTQKRKIYSEAIVHIGSTFFCYIITMYNCIGIGTQNRQTSVNFQ